jgi:hypothetical protein
VIPPDRKPSLGAAERAAVGLCAGCAHARRVVSSKGSSFWLCGRATSDARFAKYPPLPVVRCVGYEPRA